MRQTPPRSYIDKGRLFLGWGGFDSPISQRLTTFFSLFALLLTSAFTLYLLLTGYRSLYLPVEFVIIAFMLVAYLYSLGPRKQLAAYLTLSSSYLSLIWSSLFLGPDSNIHMFTVFISIQPILLLRLRLIHWLFFAGLSVFCFLIPSLPLPSLFTSGHLVGDSARHFRTFVEVSTFILLLGQGLWLLRQQAGSWRLIESRSNALKEALHFRKEITQIIAHDVKEPLATLLLGLRIAQQTDDPAEVKKHLSRMESTSLNIHRVLDYLLSLEMAEQNQSDPMIVKNSFSLRAALSDLQPIYQGRLEEKDLTLIFNESEVQEQIHCNQDTFTFQILSNLLGNAIRAAPTSSGIHLRITSKADVIELEIENLVQIEHSGEISVRRKPFGMKIVRKFCDWNQIGLEQLFELSTQRHRQVCLTRLYIPRPGG